MPKTEVSLPTTRPRDNLDRGAIASSRIVWSTRTRATAPARPRACRRVSGFGHAVIIKEGIECLLRRTWRLRRWCCWAGVQSKTPYCNYTGLSLVRRTLSDNAMTLARKRKLASRLPGSSGFRHISTVPITGASRFGSGSEIWSPMTGNRLERTSRTLSFQGRSACCWCGHWAGICGK